MPAKPRPTAAAPVAPAAESQSRQDVFAIARAVLALHAAAPAIARALGPQELTLSAFTASHLHQMLDSFSLIPDLRAAHTALGETAGAVILKAAVHTRDSRKLRRQVPR